jgi:Bacterial dnaA protein helix-turn-helix
MTIHVRPEPKTAAEAMQRVREQRLKVFGIQQPQSQPMPVPMPIVLLTAPPEPESPKETITRIIKEVADTYGIAMSEMIGRDQRPHVVTARDAAIAAVKQKYPRRSMSQLGRDFGARDHSTIITSLRRAAGHKSGGRSGRRYGQRPLAQMRLEEAIKHDLMKALCRDGWSCPEIAFMMECTKSNILKVTQDLRWELAAAQKTQAEPEPQPEVQPEAQPEPQAVAIPQPAPAPSLLRQLLSHALAWIGGRA